MLDDRTDRTGTKRGTTVRLLTDRRLAARGGERQMQVAGALTDCDHLVITVEVNEAQDPGLRAAICSAFRMSGFPGKRLTVYTTRQGAILRRESLCHAPAEEECRLPLHDEPDEPPPPMAA
jgi:hypothetical protein